jgi:hypothetical protein
MKRVYLLTALFIFLLSSCDIDNGIDTTLVDNAVKLNSPFSPFTLYRYHVESSMAFGSGFTAVKILPSDEKCDFSKRDFFTFGNDYPIQIKWKNKDTLHVICIGQGALADSQPIRREIKKWKDWNFEVEYYSIFSTGTNGDHPIGRYNIEPSAIRFTSGKREFVFNKSEVAIEIDSNQISLRQFKVDTFNKKTGFALSDYKFAMNENYRINDFYKLQPFIRTKP